MGEFEKALDLCVTDYPEFSLGKLCPIPQEPTEIHVHKAMWVEGALETFPATPTTQGPELILQNSMNTATLPFFFFLFLNLVFQEPSRDFWLLMEKEKLDTGLLYSG